MNKQSDRNDEIMEAYMIRYGLKEQLPGRSIEEAEALILCLRELKRLRHPTRKQAMMARRNLETRVNKARIFHLKGHQGFDDFLAMIEQSIPAIDRQIREKFG